jgi:hypothetical protein
MGTEGALKWYQSTRKEKLSSRQIFFHYLKGLSHEIDLKNFDQTLKYLT